MSDTREGKELIATLGSNPLPVVVSALTCGASKLHLVLTPQVEPLAERVWSLLTERGVERGGRCKLSAGAATSIVQLQDDLNQSGLPWTTAELDYTGGTKLMSAQVSAFWRQRNSEGVSSYLAESGTVVWGRPTGDSGPAVTKVDVSLTFEELARLHFERAVCAGNKHRHEALGPAADRILDYVREKGLEAWRELLPPFRPPKLQKDGVTYRGLITARHRENLKDDSPLLAHPGLPKALSVAGMGESLDDVARQVSSTKKGVADRRVDALGWLEGDWLELAFARLLEATGLFDEVVQDVKQPDDKVGDSFQVDVAAIKGHRAFVFTCTTDATSPLCKSKLFEGVQRAARLGGEYARVGLVSLHLNPHKVMATVREDGWEGYDQYRSFGLPHLMNDSASTFIARNGKPGPTETLHEALQRWVDA